MYDWAEWDYNPNLSQRRNHKVATSMPINKMPLNVKWQRTNHLMHRAR